MLELMVLWVYILALNAVIGWGVYAVLRRLLLREADFGCKAAGLASLELTGIVAITVYAQTVSLFAPVGAAAHLVLLATAIVLLVLFRRDFGALLRRFVPQTREDVRQLVLCMTLVLVTAFFACQGTQHTDTGIYHAQAIRWYEEYGVVKGLGNLQQHFAYNGASLAYSAFFSMKWLTGQSLHGTNGFLQAFLVVWSVDGLKGILHRRRHLMDGCRLAILLYAMVVSERIMSPATDFSSMYLVLWIVGLWVSCMENSEKTGEEKLFTYGNLSLAAVCVATCKLSAGLLVVIALYPGICLLRRRCWRTIALYLLLGILILLPWLARNYVISGWLLYPFTALDLFHVDWKIPAEYAQHDSDQIRVYGRCLYDVTRVQDSASVWLPLWWEEKTGAEKMLIMGNATAAAGLAFGGAVSLLRRLRARRNRRAVRRKIHETASEKIRTETHEIMHGEIRREACEAEAILPWDKTVLYLGILVCLAGWFMTAPFIRYALAFLLLLPCMVLGDWLRPLPMGPLRILSGCGCAALFLYLMMYESYYAQFDLVWIEQHLSLEHVLLQQDYDHPVVSEYEMEGGLVIYVPQAGEDNISYDAFPGSAYLSMAKRTRLRGTGIEDGFMAK